MLSCFDIANYFLAQQDNEAGDFLSNLKLQKLVYYAQGFYLAMYNEPLFSETIEAWAHGPVIPVLYHRYKEYGNNIIPTDPKFDIETIPPEKREFLDEIYRVFGQFSAWKLRNMTHDEPPWYNNYQKSGIITYEELKDYFKTQLN